MFHRKFNYSREKSHFSTKMLKFNLSENNLSRPGRKKFEGFEYSTKSITKSLNPNRFFSNGQKAAEGQFGKIKVPCALHFSAWIKVFATKCTGGTSQFFPSPQSKLKASIPAVPGQLKAELKFRHFEFLSSAKRSKICGPQILSKYRNIRSLTQKLLECICLLKLSAYEFNFLGIHLENIFKFNSSHRS